MDNKQKPLSESTLKLYNGTLDKVKKCGIDIDNVDIEELKKTCSDNDFPLSKIKLINSSLLWYSKNNNKNIDVVELLHKTVKDDIREHKYKYMNNELFENEIDKYMNWECILHVYNKLEEIYNNNKNNDNINEEYFILSLYVLLPPRRIEDYLYMRLSDKIIKREPDMILWTTHKNMSEYDNNKKYDNDKVKNIDDGLDKDFNYYLINGETTYFIFNKYKTHNIYGQQMIEINQKLESILKKYIEYKNIKCGDLFFNHSKKTFVYRLNKIFEKYIGKKISTNILKHSYITFMLSNKKITEYEKYILGLMTGHSITAQSLYKKIIDSDSEEDDKIINKININSEKIEKDILVKKPFGRPTKYNSEEERKLAKKEAKKRFIERQKTQNKN
jgi:hypothetical protein